MTFEEWWNTKDYPDCCLLRCKRAFNEGRAELEKENAELKEALKGKRCNCMTYFNFKDLEKENTKLKEQIEKMKRHCNCKHRDSEGYCEVKRTYLMDLSYDGCDKWELED